MKKIVKFIIILIVIFSCHMVTFSHEQAYNSPNAIGEKKYVTRVEDPISIEELIETIELKAIDEVDGDLSDKISYEGADYLTYVLNKDVHERSLGFYPITFTVKDKANNEAQCVINIEVIDDQAPVIDVSKSILKYELSMEDEPLTLKQIIDNIVVTDNHLFSHRIITDEYTSNPHERGVYPITIEYYDVSNNRNSVTVKVSVKDKKPPVITMDATTITKSYKAGLKVTELLAELNIVALDDCDGKVDYFITSDEYTGNENKVGKYLVSIAAKDYSGNSVSKNVIVKIIDDIAPVFYYNELVVNITIHEKLNLSQFKEILLKNNSVSNKEFSLEVIEENYSENYNQEGQYEVGLKVIYTDTTYEYQKIVINVHKPAQKKSWFANILYVIKKILQAIWNIISWPFKKLFALFSFLFFSC